MTALGKDFAGLFLPELHTDDGNGLSYTQSPCLDLNLLLKNNKQTNLVSRNLIDTNRIPS